ncbi:hypothetical protein [Campylobacter canadensis]|nr:hypothetical protein [Campylobacter canadensis]
MISGVKIDGSCTGLNDGCTGLLMMGRANELSCVFVSFTCLKV